MTGRLAATMLALVAAGCGADNSASAPSAPPVPTPVAGPALAQPALVFTGDTFPSPTSRQDIFTIESDGSGTTQLTHDDTNKFLPHFSADGTRLLYTKFTRGGYGDPNALTDVVVLDRRTGVETRLTTTGLAIQPVWSPDNRRIAHGTLRNDAIWIIDADGGNPRLVARPSGAADDLQWGDYLWSSDNWLYFTVAERIDGCFKVRIDRLRPDGSGRVKVSDGGPNCTPDGFEQSGDADPGISPDGRTLYTSRGLPRRVNGHPDMTVRHLVRLSSDPYINGKVETDLSEADGDDCIAGVPKVSPDGRRIALFRFCAADPQHAGLTLTDPSGSAFRFVAKGFGPDWNPAAK